MALSRVDLPQPLGPISDTNSPRRTDRSMPSIAGVSPNRTLRSFTESTGLFPGERTRAGLLMPMAFISGIAW